MDDEVERFVEWFERQLENVRANGSPDELRTVLARLVADLEGGRQLFFGAIVPSHVILAFRARVLPSMTSELARLGPPPSPAPSVSPVPAPTTSAMKKEAPEWGSKRHLALELRHLDRGAREGDVHVGLGPFPFHFAAPDPALVIDRAREVLRITVVALLRRWKAGNGKIPKQIPEWFRSACAPEGQSTEERWGLRDWLWWADPNRRLWFWWDARVVRPGVGVVEVEATGGPFPSEALRWLLRASGAVEVD